MAGSPSESKVKRQAEDRSPSPLAIAAVFMTLFLGGAAAGVGLAGALAAGSWVAQVVSFFALPVAFAASLQAWYGMALLSLVPRLLGRLRGSTPERPRQPGSAQPGIPGSFVFLPISSGVGAVTGIVVGLVSSTHPAWLVALVYWVIGTAHGLLGWRLARGGFLLPPESM